MTNLPIKMVTNRWDFLMPLALGEVRPKGIDLTLDTSTGMAALQSDSSFQAGEASIGHYLLRASRGAREWVGLPAFPMRAFRHRCFLVRRDSPLRGLTDLKQLEGKRVGIDGWPNSGNTWTRVVMRQDGVDIWKVNWVVAPVQFGGLLPVHATPPDLPRGVVPGATGKSLVDLTLEGEIDVMVAAFMPSGFFQPDSPLVHLIPDFPAAEAAHYRRFGYIPAHHLLTIRREVAEEHPWALQSLTDAFQASKEAWQIQRRHLADIGPWGLAELERTAATFGDDWNPVGLEPNMKMLRDLCQDQAAQGLVRAAVDPAEAFADYARLTSA
ncbi:MAG: hypothetical protein U0821_22505 [Chloroflexota bacterium]